MTSAPPSPAASATRPAAGPLSVCCVGDVMLARHQSAAARRGGAGILRPAARALLAGADVVLGNLEAPLARVAAPLRPTGFRAPPEAAALLRAFDVVSLANNHVHDCGDGGIGETLDTLADAGVLTVGVRPRGQDPYAPQVVERNGRRLAVFGCAGLGTARLPDDSAYEMAQLESPRLKPAVAAARASADAVVVMHHGGNEFVRFPPPSMRARLRELAAAGADAVISNHPHVVGGYERTATGQVVWYSLGDFIFDSEVPSRRRGCVATFRFGPGGVEMDLRATLLGVDLTVDLAPPALAARVERDVARVSRALGSRSYDATYPLRYYAEMAAYQSERLAAIYRRRGAASALGFALGRARLLRGYLATWRRGGHL